MQIAQESAAVSSVVSAGVLESETAKSTTTASKPPRTQAPMGTSCSIRN